MKNPVLEIKNRKIGIDFKPIVIAEIGINHGGSLDLAKKMALSAIQSGAEIIKHQTHVVEDEMSLSAMKIVPDNADISIYEIMKNCSLSEVEEIELKNFVEKNDSIFISTPFSREAALRLERMNVPAYKIGSGECNHLPLIELISSFNKPMIVSTGMNDIATIKKTVSILDKNENSYALLHCTNIYPTPPNLVRLNGIKELQEAFKKAVIGYSDHTINNLACQSAVALGASILERHFTDDLSRPGPDIINSMNPLQLKELIDSSKEIFKMRGGKKGIIGKEKKVSDFAFATLVAIKHINKGDIFTSDNIWAKRPGTGEIPASKYSEILGLTAKFDIKNDEHISYDQINLKD